MSGVKFGCIFVRVWALLLALNFVILYGLIQSIMFSCNAQFLSMT